MAVGFELSSFFGDSLGFFYSFAERAFSGDITSLAVLGVLVLLVLALFFKLSQFVYHFVKRFFLLLVVLLSLSLFVSSFGDKIFTDNPDYFLVSIGGIGLLIGLIAFVSSVYSLFSSYTVFKNPTIQASRQKTEGEIEKTVDAEFAQKAKQVNAKSFSENFQDERGFLALMSYSIIAQFGVFSGVTVAAPSAEVGMGFFIFFLAGALVFIKTSYHEYKSGLIHLAFALVFGFIISLILGHFWATTPLSELFSLDYFKSHSLVAFVTGIAVSLLLGSKH